MNPIGLRNTKATDWKIAYDESEEFSVGGLGAGSISFILVSEAAQRMDSFVLRGPMVKIKQKKVSGSEKAHKIKEWLEKYANPETKEKLFWPLRVLRPFSSYDLDGAMGRAGKYKILTNLVLRFHAERISGDGGIGAPKTVGRYFEHPGEGLPITGQFPDFGGAWIDGTWEMSD